MTIIQQLLLETLSSILFTMAIPNQFLRFGSFIFGLLALVPHYICIDREKSLKRLFILCFFQSLVTHVLSSFWLATFKEFAVFTLGASALGTGAISAFFAIFFYLPKMFLKINYENKLYSTDNFIKFTQSKEFKIFWFATVYTVWEFVKSRGFLGYPWGTLPMTAFNLKLLTQIVDITGVRAITFIFAFFAATSATVMEDFIFCPLNANSQDFSQQKKSPAKIQLAQKTFVQKTFVQKFFVQTQFAKTTFAQIIYKNKNILSCTLILFMLPTIYGTFQFSKKRTPQKHINTIMIQQNYDPWQQPSDYFSITESEKLTQKGIDEFNLQNKKSDLIVWSEGILHYPFPYNADIHYSSFPSQSPLIPFIKTSNAPTIIGAPWCYDLQEGLLANSAILFDKDGSIKDYYAKIHLVPFAENIPFTEYKIVQKLLSKLLGFSRGWVPGTQYKVFNIELSDYKDQTAGISIPICFEDAYPDIFKGLKYLGTDVFVNITDDSWSLTTSAEYQHFVIAWYRAIEFRTTLLRSTNSGYTVVVEPSGRILADLPLFEKSYLSYSVPVYENVFTCYMIYGEWFSYLLLISILFILWTAISYMNKGIPRIRFY